MPKLRGKPNGHDRKLGGRQTKRAKMDRENPRDKKRGGKRYKKLSPHIRARQNSMLGVYT